MHEAILKDYCDKVYKSEQIDISSEVILKLKSKKATKSRLRSGFRIRYILIISMLVSLILGCGLLIQNEFKNPEGELSWILSSKSWNTDSFEEIDEIYKSLDLDEGESVGILLDGMDQIIYRQEPIVFDSLDELNTYKDFGIRLSNKINDLNLQDVSVVTKDGSKLVDENTDLDKFEERAGYKLVSEGIEDIGGNLHLFYGVNRDVILNVNPQITNVSIGDDQEIIGRVIVEVSYLNDDRVKGQEVFEINDYQGSMMSNEDGNVYHIMYNDVFITLNDLNKQISLETFKTVVLNLFEE